MRTRVKKSRAEGGYILVLMVFMTAMLVVSTLVVGLSIKTEAKRQKEEEMIWRGKQYVRGIKLYYKKTGRYPTSFDDLTKGSGPGNIHFLRQAYKDPMNKEDGSWRLLYVGANGQLIGSLKPPTSGSLLPQAPATGLGTPAAAISTAAGPQQPGSATQQNASGAQTGANPAATPGSSDGSNSATAASDSSSNPQPITPTDTPTIIGGNIVGVASKIDQKSIIVYEKAKNYKLFEFYWDPSKDLQAAAQGAGLQLGTGLQNGTGQQPTNPFSPQGTPPPGGTTPTTGAPPNSPAPSPQP